MGKSPSGIYKEAQSCSDSQMKQLSAETQQQETQSELNDLDCTTGDEEAFEYKKKEQILGNRQQEASYRE